tara:strand:+ start:668 stop:1276 length:609 start_codon:yes stop_codon:yes gene_type:complete
MAIFNFNISQSNFQLNLLSEISTDCATYFEYEVIATPGDVLDVTLLGTSTTTVTWVSQSYQVGPGVFTDWINELTKSITYSSSGLKLIFSIENSGVAGFFNGAELTVANTSIGVTKSLTGTRFNDSPSCNVVPSTITGDKHFTYTQSLPATSWSISHNLDKMVSVSVQDTSGNTVHGEVAYTSTDTITITFINAVAGVAYLN